MAIKFKDLVDINNMAFPWIIIGILYLLLNFFFVGIARIEFPYGMLYALGFIAVALVLAPKQSGVISGLMAAGIGAVSVFTSLGNIPGWMGFFIGVGGFAVLMANELGMIELGKSSSVTKYLVFVPLVMWVLWAVTYFGARLAWNWELNIATVLNHGGILLLSIDGVLRLAGIVDKKNVVWLKWIGLLMAVVGALWLTVGLGWGLQLYE